MPKWHKAFLTVHHRYRPANHPASHPGRLDIPTTHRLTTTPLLKRHRSIHRLQVRSRRRHQADHHLGAVPPPWQPTIRRPPTIRGVP
jgi:hypothetical protein